MVVFYPIADNHRELLRKIFVAIPAYVIELQPRKVQERLSTVQGREELRELLGDLEKEARMMKEWV